MGVRPKKSRAAMMPFSVRMSIEHEPSIFLYTKLMPSTKVRPMLMSSATSSVWLIVLAEYSLKCILRSSSSFATSSRLLIFATVTTA